MEVTLIQEEVAQIKEDTPTRSQLQDTPIRSRLQDTPTKTQQVGLEVTLELVVTLTSILAEPILEAIPTRTQLPVAILTNTQAEEITQISIQLVEVTLTSIQVEVVLTLEDTLTSIQEDTQQQVDTQSEGEILARAGVHLVQIQGDTQADTQAEGWEVSPTGTQTMQSSVPATVEEVMVTVVATGWEALLSLALCRVWDTSPPCSLKALPKKP